MHRFDNRNAKTFMIGTRHVYVRGLVQAAKVGIAHGTTEPHPICQAKSINESTDRSGIGASRDATYQRELCLPVICLTKPGESANNIMDSFVRRNTADK